ncbi:MAG: signal recognition particle-docking protein FtsY [Syntrophomonadaceae bacterium]|nr:signal recognition particle-docking protein FtsY [Syntrophomonadaceae bacterium]
MGIFNRIRQGFSRTRQNIVNKVETLVKRSRTLDEEFFEELEEILIGSDIGVMTTQELIRNLRHQVKENRMSMPDEVRDVLKNHISSIMAEISEPLRFADQGTTVFLVVGVNGVGKTTTIAKLAYRFKSQGQEVLLAAADTFRAAAIEQLQVWADRVGVELIKHHPGADPAAVVFDALKAAHARKIDVLIIDTAGRLHTKTNLMKEIAKVKRVIEREIPNGPHEVLLVLDATTGQNAVSQARNFKDNTGISGIVLTKLDGTAKGGIVVALARELKVPVKLLGVGEGIQDLEDFNSRDFAAALFMD